MTGRPDYHADSPVTLRLPADLRKWVDRRAQGDGRSRSAVIIEAVQEKRERDDHGHGASAAEAGRGITSPQTEFPRPAS